MVIDNLNMMRMPITPNKTYSPLIIDPYAVLPGTLPGQSLKPVTRRYTQGIQCNDSIKHPKFSQCRPLNIKWDPARAFTQEKLFSVFTVK